MPLRLKAAAGSAGAATAHPGPPGASSATPRRIITLATRIGLGSSLKMKLDFIFFSTACQNPSFTYMALTARACAYAVAALKRGAL